MFGVTPDRREYVLSRELQRQERMLLRMFDRSERLVIFDIGACEGENAVRYGRLFPRASVYAVEPLPQNVALMNRAVVEYAADNVTPIEACLADREAEVDFHISAGTPAEYSGRSLDWDFGNKSSSLLVLGSAADQPDSPRNTGHEQVKSVDERADGVYLCAEGSPELQPAAGASSASSGGALICSFSRMARCAAVISLRWEKLPAAPRKLPRRSFSSS